MIRHLFVSYFDGNDNRKVASSRAQAVGQILRRCGNEVEAYSGYDNITTIIHLDDNGLILDTETVDLGAEAEEAAAEENALAEAARREDARDHAWHEWRAA